MWVFGGSLLYEGGVGSLNVGSEAAFFQMIWQWIKQNNWPFSGHAFTWLRRSTLNK